MYANVSEPRRPVVFIEGWLEHWSENKEWRPYWCVLKDGKMHFFNGHCASEDSLQGTIALGPESRLEKITDDQRSGFMFHLRTRMSVNTFIASKFTDREHWKACVEGIALGRVSDTIDLLPGQKEEIKNLLQQYLRNKSPSLAPTSELEEYGFQDGFDSPHSSTSGSFAPRKDKLDYLVPVVKSKPVAVVTQKYRFHSDSSRTGTPSWFFSDCTRDQAKSILTLGGAYGNTLMRESATGKKNLVISKKMEASSNGEDFTHYIVQWSPQGYKIEVENSHEPMQSLSEVMDFFVVTSGKLTTRPMKTNDLQILGIEECDNDYNKRIMSSHHDPDSGEEVDTDIVKDSRSMDRRDVPAPPPLPVPCTSRNIAQQQKIADSQDSWRLRSESVPNISAKEIDHIQSVRWKEVAVGNTTKSFTMRITSNPKKEGLFGQTFRPNSASVPLHSAIASVPLHSAIASVPLHSAIAIPSIPKNKQTPRSDDVPPPLPPNHPPPKKSLSQSDFKIIPDDLPINGKKMGPKHTQSMSSADLQNRKTSPRDLHSAAQATDELARVAARINRNRETVEESEAGQYYTEPENEYDLDRSVKSPTVASESFKKILEGLIGNQTNTGLKPHIPPVRTSSSDYSDTAAHYQNC